MRTDPRPNCNTGSSSIAQRRAMKQRRENIC
nr:MAG TPA: hypothetical protein [Caudoviricetes sp.]